MKTIPNNRHLSYSLVLECRFIVYLSDLKYKNSKRSIINVCPHPIDVEKFCNQFSSINNMIILTQSDQFLEDFDPIELNQMGIKILEKLKKCKSEHCVMFDQEEELIELAGMLKFTIDYRNDLIFYFPQTGKVVISRNSYYVTNVLSDFEMCNFPISKIDDVEILQTIKGDFDAFCEDIENE